MQQALNIDIEILKRYRSTKARKELLAMAIWCHFERVNAVIFGFNVTYVRKHLHVGKTKAERLLSDAREDTALFSFTGDTVRANTLRDKTVKAGKRGRTYQSANVYRIAFDSDREYSLREIYNLINEILTERPLVAMEHRDCLNQCGGLRGRSVGSTDARYTTLPLRKLSENNGMSQSSTRRVLKRLQERGAIDKQPCVQITKCVGDSEGVSRVLQATGLKKATFYIAGLLYFILPCSYAVTDRAVTDAFHHKIYNYHKEGTVQRGSLVSTIPQLNGF